MKNIFATAVVNPEYRFILVSKGCKSNCTFCVIKKSKGSLKSRGLAEIESEVLALANDGESSFWLLGDDLGCWGKDVGLTLNSLLEQLLKIDNVNNLVLGNLDPRNEYSPLWSIQNIQFTWAAPLNNLEIYLGVKNLLNFTPPSNSITRTHDPFDKKVNFYVNIMA